MTPEQQRIAIATACGALSDEAWENARTSPYRIESIEEHLGIADYLNDLNAMHEAEKHLDPVTQLSTYIYQLQTICGGQFFGQNYLATAAQRAEAFLRTRRLWKE